jgi:hypothetical protein
MRFPNWICVNCGQPSGRKWNIQRHIRICHNSVGNFVSFTEYLVGRQTGTYQPTSPPTSPPIYHSKKTNSLDIFMEEAMRELARKIVNQTFLQRPTWRQNLHGYTSGMSSSSSQPQPSPIDSNDIIGYRGCVCKDCLETNIEEMHLLAYDGKGIGQMKHVCEPNKLAESSLYTNTDKSFRLKEREKKLPLEIRNLVVNNWTKNRNYLVAVKLSNQQAEMVNNFGQNYIDLTLTNDNNNNNHWSVRAIKNSNILLSENEFIDFMRKVQNATFAIFKINMEGSVNFYAMAITNGP